MAANVLKWGTGALNIDGTRIPIDPNEPNSRPNGSVPLSEGGKTSMFKLGGRNPECDGNTLNLAKGRWPSHLILDEDAAKMLDEQSGVSKSSKNKVSDKRRHTNEAQEIFGKNMGGERAPHNSHDDTGGASRFFLCYNRQECGLKNTKDEDTFAGKNPASINKNLSIAGYGRKPTDQFLMGTISITEMGTHSIMSFPILNASTKTFIGTITVESGKTIGSSLAESVVGVSVVSATEVLIHLQNGAQEPITGIVSLASDNTSLAGVIETANTGTRTIGHIAANRFLYCAKASPSERNAGLEGMPDKVLAKSGGAAAAAARGESYFEGSGFNKTQTVKNNHPTVKPQKLMRYLCRLVTPPGGTVLDPFTGSGSTAVACELENFKFVGVEMETEYVEIARKRAEWATLHAKR